MKNTTITETPSEAALRHPRFGLLAALGALLSLPALLLFISGMLRSFGGVEVMLLPEALLHPAVIMGGLLISASLNAPVVLKVQLRNEEDHFRISLDIVKKMVNVAVLGLALFLMAAILLYVLGENFVFTPH